MHRSRRPHRSVAALVVLGTLAAGVSACSSSSSSADAPYLVADCQVADADGRSIARVWDEELLGLIRQVIPAPTVHARNLLHLSIAMWDAWAAYDPTADGYLVTEKHEADDVGAARSTAISYAAYRILLWRYATVSDLATAEDELGVVMASLCLRTDYTAADGDSPADLGNRIADAVLAFGSTDGSLEEDRYVDGSYVPVNEPMVVADPGTVLADPNRWQPLSLGMQIAQNGLPIPGNVQEFLGAQWGHVTPFALASDPDGVPIDPGPPPRLGDPATDKEYRDDAVDVLRYSAQLDASDGVMIDISPGAIGDNPLGTNDGDGHDLNPATGEPYRPNLVHRADYERILAEYWADGPHSETPPGHWNLFANAIQDMPGFERRLGGEGPELDPLEWDVKVYLALNGALHDAAIAAWGLKRHYDSVRPISMIRYLGGNGQSSDPDGPSYDPQGLPLEPGLVEVITEESSAPGERHEHLADHVGEVAVFAWRGSPEDPTTETSGVGWILAIDWVPYQRPTFVTPSFAGYVSGHSTFSRAGAEVLTALTGSEYFPGGLYEFTVRAGDLIHEEGPTEDVTVQIGTFRDAADQAGISRLYGGIHIPADDVEGRRLGAQIGQEAVALASTYFDGSARP